MGPYPQKLKEGVKEAKLFYSYRLGCYYTYYMETIQDTSFRP